MLAYSFLLTVGLVLSSPWWLLRMATTERYGEGLWQRLGSVPYALKIYVRRVRIPRRVVWVHAVSVGEVLAASRLVAELGEALGKDWRVVISTTTRTGQALAQERFGTERVFYCPLDFAVPVRLYLRALRPSALVLMESEIWPRMLHECKLARVPVVVVNARVSDRSFARALKVKSVWGRVLRMPTLWLAQSEEDARRLVALGASGESVRIGGNLKYDVRAPKESRVAELIKEVAAGRPIIVAGSTVGGTNDADPEEEGWLITTWAGKALNEMGAMLVLAPRHPERFEMVWKDAIEFPAMKVTDLLAGDRTTRWEAIKPGPEQADIVLLDTIGDLAGVYSVADLAFVGGSLIERGGHNPLEPAQFGVPVIIGPSYENFRDIVGKMLATDAIFVTGGSAQGQNEPRESNGLYRPEIYAMRDSLASALVDLLKDREAARSMGDRGRAVFEAQQGATARAVEAIVGMVKQ